MVVVRKHEVKKEATDKQVRRASRRQKPRPLSIPAARTELENIGLVGRMAAGNRLPMAENCVSGSLTTGPACGSHFAQNGKSSKKCFRVVAQLNPRSHHAQPVCWCEGASPSVPAPLSLRREDPGLWAPATLKLILPPPKHRRRRYMRCASIPRRLRPVPHALALACAVRHALLFIILVVVIL
jgi:hypothetical protein